MSGMTVGIIALGVTLTLLVLRIHIGVTMIIGGMLPYLIINNWDWTALLFTINNLVYTRLSNYDLAVIPLFVLMGQFATHGGLSRTIFRSASAFVGHIRGGLGIAAVGTCAGFGAICGSSLATSATMSQVALPELRRHNYPGNIAGASIAVGGTLGILIPPSVPLIVYAVITQESIAKLFVAAVIPSVLAVAGYSLVMWLTARKHNIPTASELKSSWGEKLVAFLQVTPIIGIFLVVIVGIYGGWSNPTEAAAIGASAAAVLAVIQGKMRLKGFIQSIYGTAETTAIIFLILLGADLLNSGLAITQMPNELAMWVQSLPVAPLLILGAILIIYIVLGCVMDSLAMLLLTIPIFYPIVMGLDFFGLDHTEKSIWFGILALMIVEIGLITPPMGMNLFIVHRHASDIPFLRIAKAVVPFLISDFVRITILLFFPAITLFLLRL